MAFATPNVGADKYTGYSYEGKQIVLTKQRGNGIKKERHNNLWWPEEKRIEVATLWAVLRSVPKVSELTKVSQEVIRRWKEEPWFHNVVQRVVKEKNDILDQKLTGVIENAAELIQERLVKGDIRVNYKTGQHYEVPMDARTLALMVGILFDKRQLLRGEATSRTETISFDRRLENLKETFERFSKATQIEGIAENVTIQSEESEKQGEQETASQTVLEGQGEHESQREGGSSQDIIVEPPTEQKTGEENT